MNEKKKKKILKIQNLKVKKKQQKVNEKPETAVFMPVSWAEFLMQVLSPPVPGSSGLGVLQAPSSAHPHPPEHEGHLCPWGTDWPLFYLYLFFLPLLLQLICRHFLSACSK